MLVRSGGGGRQNRRDNNGRGSAGNVGGSSGQSQQGPMVNQEAGSAAQVARGGGGPGHQSSGPVASVGKPRSGSGGGGGDVSGGAASGSGGTSSGGGAVASAGGGSRSAPGGEQQQRDEARPVRLLCTVVLRIFFCDLTLSLNYLNYYTLAFQGRKGRKHKGGAAGGDTNKALSSAISQSSVAKSNKVSPPHLKSGLGQSWSLSFSRPSHPLPPVAARTSGGRRPR